MEMEKRINSQEQEEDVIDLMEIARLLLHKWKLLFIALLAGAVLGGAYCAFLLETTYRAEASLYITSNEFALVFLRSAVKLRADRGLCVHYQEPYRS